MKKLNWDKETLDLSIEILGKCEYLEDALEWITEDVGVDISKDMLDRAFRRNNLDTPISYLCCNEIFGTESEEDYEPSYKIKYPRGTSPKNKVPIVDSGPIEKLSGYLLCVSDSHFGIQDKHIEEGTVALARDLADEGDLTVVFNGDMLDNWLASRFDKDPRRRLEPGAHLQEELDELIPYLQAMSDSAEHVYYGMGNHEYRLEKLVTANPALFGLRGLNWDELLEIPDNVTLYDYGYRIHIGPVTFLHGDPNGAPTASAMLKKYPRLNTVFGHTHRADTAHSTDYDYRGKEMSTFSINQGHCSDTKKQDYVHKPNWQKSFVVIHYFETRDGIEVDPHLVMVRNDTFSYNGKIYGKGTCK